MTTASGLGPLIVVTPESPLPAIHGARVDIWNRWRMLHTLGWTLVLVTWRADGEAPDPATARALGQVFARIHWLDKPSGLSGLLVRMAGLPRHSPHVWTRRIGAGQLAAMKSDLKGQRPAGVVLDSLYGALAARALARHFRAPLLHRAHNIEHLYMPKQARVAQGLKRRLAIRLASVHLRRLENEIHREAAWTFDISQNDLTFWRKLGFSRGSWLPPLVDAPPTATLAWQDRLYDVLYLGNLNTPNNVAGLAWFFDSVMPELDKRRPGLRVAVAGSHPSDQVRALVSACPGASLLANPVDVAQVRAEGRVLINPVLSGSGVNVKSVEMLFTDSPIVTTRIGVQGLSADVQAAFKVCDDPAEFAAAINTALEHGPMQDAARDAARAVFGPQAAEELSTRLLALLGQHGPTV